MARIAFIHNSFPAGGAERITIDIARHLSCNNKHVFYVYTTRVKDNLLPNDIHDFITIRLIPSQAIQSIRSHHVEKLICADQINIIVMVGKSIYGINNIKRRTGIKSILACHGAPFWQRHIITNRRKKGVFNHLLWHLYNKKRFSDGTLAMQMAIKRTLKDYSQCDAYTVLCDSYKEELIDVLNLDRQNEHIHVIENPESPIKHISYSKEKMILFCGRLENWSKRVDRLLNIWSVVQSSLSEWQLYIVGDGPAKKMLYNLSQELKLERVHFEGWQPDVSRYYDKASIVCLTSETEGWPLALTEAQSHGCICVAYGTTSGIFDILSPQGKCGFIVPPSDEKAYADTLLQIASLSKEEENRIRKNAVKKRLNYAPNIIAKKWEVLFDSLMITNN